jgi:hypothetical protein
MTDRSIDIREHRSAGSSRSFGDVFGDLSNELTGLVHRELQSAKDDLRATAPTGGRAALLAVGATAAGALAVLFVSLAAAIGLAELVPTGFAFLLVGVAYLLAAAVLYQRRRNVLTPSLDPVDGNNY